MTIRAINKNTARVLYGLSTDTLPTIDNIDGDLIIFTDRATIADGEPLEVSWDEATSSWFVRLQKVSSAEGNNATKAVSVERPLTEGTLAEMAVDELTLTPKDKGKRFQATDDNDRVYSYKLIGTSWRYTLEPVPGVISVDSIGKQDQAHNRERIAVTSIRQRVNYTAAQNVTQITVQVTDTATGPTQANAMLALAFDAFDNAEADSWLTETDLESFDTQRHLVQVGADPVVFNFSEAIGRIDFKAVGSETLRVFIGGV